LQVTIGGENFIVGHEDVAGVPGDWTGTIQDCRDFILRISP
jgi:hypothetical protein